MGVGGPPRQRNKANPSCSQQFYLDSGLIDARKSAGIPAARQGEKICLKCERPFMSTDVVKIRICPRCKQYQSQEGSIQEGWLYHITPTDLTSDRTKANKKRWDARRTARATAQARDARRRKEKKR